jgi:hypothetical protein
MTPARRRDADIFLDRGVGWSENVRVPFSSRLVFFDDKDNKWKLKTIKVAADTTANGFSTKAGKIQPDGRPDGIEKVQEP